MKFFKISRQKTHATSCILVMMTFVFVIKSILPVGFMPVINKDGFTQIVICSGIGQKTITVPSDDAPAKEHQDTPSDKVCAYQILASAKPLLSPPAVIVPAPAILRVDFKAHNDQTPVAISVVSFDARGPPLA